MELLMTGKMTYFDGTQLREVPSYNPHTNGHCKCSGCEWLRSVKPQPTVEDAAFDALREVGRKWLARGITPQTDALAGVREGRDDGVSGSDVLEWYRAHGPLGLPKPVTEDTINALLDEIRENDRRIQDASDRSFAIGYERSAALADERSQQSLNAFYDRKKLEAHEARMERNIPPTQPTPQGIELRNRYQLDNAMQQPTHTDLPLNEQVLSARWGRGS